MLNIQDLSVYDWLERDDSPNNNKKKNMAHPNCCSVSLTKGRID